MKKILLLALALGLASASANAARSVRLEAEAFNTPEDSGASSTSYIGARGVRVYLNPSVTITDTAFAASATGAETTLVLPSGTVGFKLGINLPGSSTEAVFINFASGNASNGTGRRVNVLDTYTSPLLESPSTGTSVYISSAFSAVKVWVEYWTERYVIQVR